MNPTHFPEANLRLLAPPSMPECLPLSVHRYAAHQIPAVDELSAQEYHDLTTAEPCTCQTLQSLREQATDHHEPTCARRLQEERMNKPSPVVTEPGGYISRWLPTPEERHAIAAGGAVWVYVVGDGSPPPIAVSGVSPFGQPEAGGDPAAIYRPGIEVAGGEVEAWAKRRAHMDRLAAEDDAEVAREVARGLLSHMEARQEPGATAAPATPTVIALAYGGKVNVDERTMEGGALVTVLKTGAAGAVLTRQDAIDVADELLRRANGETQGPAAEKAATA